MALIMDREGHRLVHYLKYNNCAHGLDWHMLGIHDIDSVIKRARKHGYKIKKKSTGILWNKEETLCLKQEM